MKPKTGSWFVALHIAAAVCAVAVTGIFGLRAITNSLKRIATCNLVVELAASYAELSNGEEALPETELLAKTRDAMTAGGSAFQSSFRKFPILVDAWGIPLSHTHFRHESEWRSAGLDHILHTKDDFSVTYTPGQIKIGDQVITVR